MRNFKRFLTLALAVMMVVSAFAFGTSAAKFTDVDENNAYLAKAVNLLNYVGVVKGTSDTTFGTDELVTREQMAAFIYRLMKKGQSVEGGENSSVFTDLEDPTFFFMVSWAAQQDIIKGTSATTFEPKGSIILQDAYTMIVRALGYEKEQTLSYPFSYIDIAESKGVELDEGLSSDVAYTDALTRGDVAILLYNAFFAKTGVAETKQVEEEIGKGENATWVLKTVTEYPTLCEKVFDVLELEYQAVATPHYFYESTEYTEVEGPTSDLGYDAIQFALVENESGVDVETEFYVAFDDLGLDGDADDYIMSHFTMYVTVDEDGVVENVLYAEPLLNKITVTELDFDTLSSNGKNSFYGSDEDANSDAKRLSGKVTFDGKVAYFYNAPYSYAKPSYKDVKTEAEKYEKRNEKNLATVSFKLDDKKKEVYSIKVDANAYTYDVDDEYFVDASEELVETYAQAYAGGLYEADLYDIDGDGLYDLIDYKPYMAAFVNTDDDYDFWSDGYDKEDGSFIPTLYTEGADIEGEEFEDEDLVIGWFDKATNYIKIAAVVAPVKADVADFDPDKGTITLDNEDVVTVNTAWQFLANYDVNEILAEVNYDLSKVFVDDSAVVDGAKYLDAATAYDAENVNFYVYNGVLLADDGVESNTTYNSDLILITMGENGEYFEDGTFNAAVGGKARYAYAWVDGKLQYVTLDTESEDIYPLIFDADEYAEDGGYNVEYVNKVATYTVDANGVYSIQMLGNAYSDADLEDYIGLKRLEDIEDVKDYFDSDNAKRQVYVEYNENEMGYQLVKTVGKRFELAEVEATEEKDDQLYEVTEASANILPEKMQLLINDDTLVLIRSEYLDEKGNTVIDYKTFDVKNLTETIDNPLLNVQMVIGNNTSSPKRENLVLLYAEVDGKLGSVSDEDDDAQRIVTKIATKLNADKEYYNEYTLYNPYTGATEVANGNKTWTKASAATSNHVVGTIINLLENGQVKDLDSVGNSIFTYTKNNYYWVLDYDKNEKTIEVAPYINGRIDSDIEEGGTLILDVEDAGISVLTNRNQGNDNFFKWDVKFEKGNFDNLVDGGTDAMKWNHTYWDAEDESAESETWYRKNAMAYIDFDVDDDDKDVDGTVNFVTVLVRSESTADSENYEELE